LIHIFKEEYFSLFPIKKGILLKMRPNVSQIPSWLAFVGWIALPGTLLLALDLTYESTSLTWSQGEQMIGFSVSHLIGPLVLLSFLSAIVCHVFLFVVFVFVLSGRLQVRQLSRLQWTLVFILLICACTLYIPYRIWKRATIAVRGPGPHAGQFLVYAAHDGDKSTVELLLNRGVPVDTLNGDSTALNGACAGRQIGIARFLLSKGAELSRAPDCRNILSLLHQP
jgi:hypothetical protein